MEERWKDDGRIFSASTGFGSDDSSPLPTAVFLGDGDGGGGAIDDPSFKRVFHISGARVVGRELDKNKVIAMLDCPNPYTYEVKVAPHVTE